MSTISSEIVVLLFAIANCTASGVVLHNLECMPRPAVISTSRIDAEYFPYFVNLHRCEGSQNKTPPLLKKCVADKEEKLTISAESITTGRRVELVVVNHTSCKAECAGNRNECKPPAHFDEQSCKCICDLGINGPDEKRCSDPRKEWKKNSCGCVCKQKQNCSNRREYFDENSCSCRCKAWKLKGDCSYNSLDFDASTCSCLRKAKAVGHTTEKKNTTTYWLAAVAIELVVMSCVFEAFLYSKRSGLVFFVKEKVVAAKKVKGNTDCITHDAMAYREVLKCQSGLSTSLRKRSSRLSSVSPATPSELKSPAYIGEEVFFAE